MIKITWKLEKLYTGIIEFSCFFFIQNYNIFEQYDKP